MKEREKKKKKKASSVYVLMEKKLKNPSSSLKINLNLIQLRRNYYMSFKNGCRLIVLRPEVPGYFRGHTQKLCKIIHQCEQKKFLLQLIQTFDEKENYFYWLKKSFKLLPKILAHLKLLSQQAACVRERDCDCVYLF
jgi:hypothetical protein